MTSDQMIYIGNKVAAHFIIVRREWKLYLMTNRQNQRSAHIKHNLENQFNVLRKYYRMKSTPCDGSESPGISIQSYDLTCNEPYSSLLSTVIPG